MQGQPTLQQNLKNQTTTIEVFVPLEGSVAAAPQTIGADKGIQVAKKGGKLIGNSG